MIFTQRDIQGAGIAEAVLEIAEPQAFALSPLQLLRWSFRFRV
jgi:hypothetical protein